MRTLPIGATVLLAATLLGLLIIRLTVAASTYNAF